MNQSEPADSIIVAREDLRAALAGIELTESESRIMTWLEGWDQPTLHTIADIIRKARAAGPVGG